MPILPAQIDECIKDLKAGSWHSVDLAIVMLQRFKRLQGNKETIKIDHKSKTYYLSGSKVAISFLEEMIDGYKKAEKKKKTPLGKAKR